MIPCWRARRTASRRFSAANFMMIAETWWSTVFSEMYRRAANSALVDPSLIAANRPETEDEAILTRPWRRRSKES